MGYAATKISARRAVREAQLAKRLAQLERDRACEDAAVTVLTALGRRDECELEAGRALRQMSGQLGMTRAEVLAACPGLSVGDLLRLRRLAEAEHDEVGAGGAGERTSA